MCAGPFTLDLPVQNQQIGLYFYKDPQGSDSTNCSFYHINVSNTMVAAAELTSYSTNHIHESFALSMSLFWPHSVITAVVFINEVCMYKEGIKG